MCVGDGQLVFDDAPLLSVTSARAPNAFSAGSFE